MTEQAGCGEPSETGAVGGGAHERISVFQSVGATLSYLKEAGDDKSIITRQEDRTSATMLRMAVIFGIIFVVAPVVAPNLHGVGFACTVLADTLLTAALVWFVARRFGILRTMTKRHAVLCCELMLGTGVLMTMLAINIVAIIIMTMMGDRLINSMFGG